MDATSRDTHQRIAELEARVADLTARLESAIPTADPVERTTDSDEPAVGGERPSRRAALRLAGAAVAGVVGAAVAVRPAAAANGDPLTLGGTPTDDFNTASSPTRVNYTGGSPNSDTTSGFLFQAGPGINANTGAHGAALAGSSREGQFPESGVYGFSDNDGAYGVIGHNDKADGTGVFGVSDDGTGVTGSSTNGTGVSGVSSGANSSGVIGIGGFAGVVGFSGDYSVASLLSDKSNLYLQPNNNLGDSLIQKIRPPQRTDAHRQGEMENVDGELWWCVVGGTPGAWRKISGPLTAGAFHAITPARVYDSRAAEPAMGLLTVGVPHTVSVAASRNLDTGAVLNLNLVPVGATAVLANVTVVHTIGAGFLAINPGTLTAIGASSVNWYDTGQILNNGVSLTLGGDRLITIIAGGSVGAATDVVIDITGYFL